MYVPVSQPVGFEWDNGQEHPVQYFGDIIEEYGFFREVVAGNGMVLKIVKSFFKTEPKRVRPALWPFVYTIS